MAKTEEGLANDLADLVRRSDDDEVDVVEAPYGGEYVGVSEEPWDLPNFTLEVAQQIGAIAADLMATGEWYEIEETLLALVGKTQLPVEIGERNGSVLGSEVLANGDRNQGPADG